MKPRPISSKASANWRADFCWKTPQRRQMASGGQQTGHGHRRGAPQEGERVEAEREIGAVADAAVEEQLRIMALSGIEQRAFYDALLQGGYGGDPHGRPA